MLTFTNSKQGALKWLGFVRSADGKSSMDMSDRMFPLLQRAAVSLIPCTLLPLPPSHVVRLTRL